MKNANPYHKRFLRPHNYVLFCNWGERMKTKEFKPRPGTWPTILTFILLVFIIAGCEVLGPRSIKSGRSDYNEAINKTDVEQLLLNIVRMRSNDRPYFLEIANITSVAEMEAGIGAEGQFNETLPDTYIGRGSLRYLQRPTIIYQPLTGEKFVRQLLEPVDLNTILLLRLSGWEMDDIMRVFANRINTVPNAPTAGDSTPEGIPEYEDFLKIVEAMDELEDAGEVTVGASEAKELDELVIDVYPDARKTENFQKFARLLNLDPDSDTYRIRIGLTRGGGDQIIIETRPIMSAMFYLGRSIELPEGLIDDKTIQLVRDKDGQPFDWQKVFKGLIRIRTSAERPRDTYASVFYEGYWYYIPNDDIDSRETLTMLSIVLTLKAGGIPSKGPVLTLPVGGG